MESNSGIRIFVDAHVFDGEFQGTRTFIKGIYTILARKNDVQLYLGAHNTGNLKKDFSGLGNVHFVKYKSTVNPAEATLRNPCHNKKIQHTICAFSIHFPASKKL